MGRPAVLPGRGQARQPHGRCEGFARRQATVGRRLASLEENLSGRLLHRTPDGYRLTLAGEIVWHQAERVEAEALAVERNVGGHDEKLQEWVRVSCTETLAVHVLAPCFVALQHHPDIQVELVPKPLEVSLAMREADIAVRLAPSDRNDLVVRRVGRMTFGLHASRSTCNATEHPTSRRDAPATA